MLVFCFLQKSPALIFDSFSFRSSDCVQFQSGFGAFFRYDMYPRVYSLEISSRGVIQQYLVRALLARLEGTFFEVFFINKISRL